MYGGAPPILPASLRLSYPPCSLDWSTVENVVITPVCACLFLVLSASLALMLASDCSLTDALFDACSSFGLGGYSVGVAREDNPAALFILATAMVVGRLGPMTIAYAINRPRALESIRYPNEPIVVG